MIPVMPVLAPRASPQQILNACGGYYECPRDAAGKRVGPLVGYAGRDKTGRQYVGDLFANFAKIEQWPAILQERVATPLGRIVWDWLSNDRYILCGAPEGGKMLAYGLTLTPYLHGSRCVYPDKVTLKEATATSRAETELRFTGRHEIYAGEQLIIVEDVCNNFSTTGQLIGEIRSRGASVAAVACFLNRSPSVDAVFECEGRNYPVLPLWRHPMPEYTQDDPEVTDDLARGNVVWKPKDHWDELQRAA